MTILKALSTTRWLWLVAVALFYLLLYDVVNLAGFRRAYALVRRCKVAQKAYAPGDIAAEIATVVDAIAEACIWYGRRAYCLQRSAVTTVMLRRRGIAASLVMGFRPIPFDSHAWVEVDGNVVNDRPQYQRFFQVIDRL